MLTDKLVVPTSKSVIENRHAPLFSIVLTGGVSCLCCATVAIFMACNTQAFAASADTALVHDTITARSLTASSNKKPKVSCDVPAVSKNSSAEQQKSHGHGCLVSLSELDKLRTQKDFNLVDVRTPSQYARYRIADSINIPLHLLKAKEFLKKLSVVLVNDGRSTLELEKTCADLKQSGYTHIAVLDGGLLAWNASQRVLEGDPAEKSRLNRMSADELFEVRSLSNWSVIDMSTKGIGKDMRSWLPASVIAVPIKAKGDLIARVSSVVSQQRKRNPQVKVLLIADDNNVYDRVDASLQKSGVTTGILRLDGGINGYREHVKRQLALWSQQNQPRRYEACRG